METDRRSKEESLPPVDPVEILAHVDQLLAAPDFRIPPRRARLLHYLAEHAAGGAINEYAIGVDVFDRPPSFDPRTDAVVRAEVRRLRQNLTEYYEGPGAALDPVLELPPRSYVPVLRVRMTPASTTRPPHVVPPRKLPRWLAIAALAVLALGFAWPWFGARSLAPPPFSLAVLPASVAPSAAGFDGADALSQEIAAALWSAPGLSVLDWMKVSSFRGPAAVSQARSQLPVALILDTQVSRPHGGLEVQFRLFGHTSDRVLWSRSAPLPDASHVEAGARALVAAYLAPFLQREFNVFSYRRATGRTRIPPILPEPAPVPTPCAAGPPVFGAFGRTAAQVTIGAQALEARSPDTRIEIFANGQRAYPSTTVHTFAGASISLRAPALADLAADSCVLTGSSGDAPVYPEGCLVAPPGVSHVWLQYACSPKTQPLDIARFANDANLWNEETFPSGMRNLAGVPFRIPDGINRFRDAGDDMRGARPVTLMIPVDRPGVSRVFFLINTAWGQPGPASYLSITFAGDRGASFEKKLIGGVDIRDYNRGVYTNTVDGVQSRPAFDNGLGQRIDMVEIDLPAAFRQQTLKTITMLDTGRWTFQRAILWAVSVR